MDSGRAAITAAVITGILGLVAAVVTIVPNLLDDGTGGDPPGGGGNSEVQLFANKESAPVGATVQVSGQGFAASESVEILIGAHIVGTTRTGPGGDFANVSVKVPDFFKGFPKPMQVDIHATGKSSIRSARVAFTIS